MKPPRAVLESATLRFEIIDESHLQDVFNTMNSRETAEILTFLTWPITEKHARDWVEISVNGFGVGCICVVPWQSSASKVEIGYWVTESWKGNGIATEMIRAALDFVFGTLKASAVVATVAAQNAGSIAAVRKFGFHPTGEMDKLTAKGKVLKLTIYELETDLRCN